MSYQRSHILSETQAIQIFALLESGKSQREIAAEFGISKRTVSRMNTGVLWEKVKLRMEARNHPPILGLPHLIPMTQEQLDLIDDMTAIRNAFALDDRQPIYWGWFETETGIHPVAGDGIILWEHENLLKLALRYAKYPEPGYPVWPELAEELPTQDLYTLFTQPVGPTLTLDFHSGSLSRFRTQHKKTLFLQQKFLRLAYREGLELHEIEGTTEYIYLTRAQARESLAPVACVATYEP